MQTNNKVNRKIQVMMLGGSGVGKTSMILNLTGEKIGIYHTSIGIDFRFYMYGSLKLRIFDTPGQERFRAITKQYYRAALGFVFVFDVNDRNSLEDLVFFINQAREYTPSNIPGIVVGNKCDDINRREVSEEEGRNLAKEYGLPYYETSAKDGTNIRLIFHKLADEISGVLYKPVFEEYFEPTDDKFYFKESILKVVDLLINSITTLNFPDIDGLKTQIIQFYKKYVEDTIDIKDFDFLKFVSREINSLQNKIFEYSKIIAFLPDYSKNTPAIQSFEAILFLKDVCFITLYNYQINFLKFILNRHLNVDRKAILKNSLFVDMSNVHRRKRQFLAEFHPDFLKYQNKEDLHLFYEIKTLVEDIEEELKIDLENDKKENEMDYFAKLAKRDWDYAIGYINALKKEYTKLGNFLTKDDVVDMKDKDIKAKINYHSNQCYFYYKSAYKAADRNPLHIDQQLHYRGDAALANYIMGHHLKANLYILAANLIGHNNNSSISQSEIDNIIKIGSKVSEGKYNEFDFDTLSTKIDNNFNNDSKIKKNSNDLNTEIKENKACIDLKNALVIVNRELQALHVNKTNIEAFNSKNVVTKHQNFKELKEKIYQNIFLGLTYQIKEFATSSEEEYFKLKIIKTERNIKKYMYWLFVPGMIAYGIAKIWDYFKEKNQAKEIQKIYEKIYSIINKAVEAFNNKQYALFLEILLEKYDEDKSLIKCGKNKIKIKTNNIIDTLLKYAFKPDFIAQFLNLIGISLINGIEMFGQSKKQLRKLALIVFDSILCEKLVDESVELDKLYNKKVESSKAFGSYSQIQRFAEQPFRINLEESRNCTRVNLATIYILKDKQYSIKLISDVESSYKEFHMLPVDISLDLIKDLISLLHCVDLREEVGNKLISISDIKYAQINDKIQYCYPIEFNKTQPDDYFTHLCTLSKSKIKMDKELFIELFIKNFEDSLIGEEIFLNIFKYETVSNIHEWQNKFITNCNNMFEQPYREYFKKYFNISFNIFVTREYKQKFAFINNPFLEINNSTFDCNNSCAINLVTYEKENKISGGFIYLDSADLNSEWALKNFEEIDQKVLILHELAKQHMKLAEEQESISYLLSLEEYKKAKDLYGQILEIDPMNNKDNIFEFSLCLIKLGKFEDVKNYLYNLKILDKNKEYWYLLAVVERKTNSLTKAKENIAKCLKIDKNYKEGLQEFEILKELMIIKGSESTVMKYYKNNDEINMSCKRLENSNQYKILSLDGGGVRGALEALWLSEIEFRTKKPISSLFNMICGTSTGGLISAGLSIEHENLIGTPKFKAYELLNLYLTESQLIFSDKRNIVGNLTQPKFGSEKKKELLVKYFKDATIDNSLTELVITAVTNKNIQETFLFNSFNCRKNNISLIKNTYSFVDTLMATTAAPTFFEAHKIGEDYYIDGGVQLNNPAMKACSEAKRYGVKEEDMFILSLGTGIYASNPLKMKDSQGLLFWMSDIHKVLMSSQESNTNVDMHYRFGDRYQRWQVKLHKPISLDDYNSVPDLIDIGRDYIAEIIQTDKFKNLLNLFDD